MLYCIHKSKLISLFKKGDEPEKLLNKIHPKKTKSLLIIE